MPLRLHLQLFCFSASCVSTYLHPLIEAEALNSCNKNNNNLFYLKSALPSQSAFTYKIWFHLHRISPHSAGIPQGSVHSSISFTLHSLPGKYYPHLWILFVVMMHKSLF